MVRAIRTVSVERGHDPRNYCLLPFGGAGPLHASEVARSLGIATILVPAAPGILCAQGLIASDLKDDFVRSIRARLDGNRLDALHDHLAGLLQGRGGLVCAERTSTRAATVKLSFDMRYVGQNFELPVPIGTAKAGKAPRLIGAATPASPGSMPRTISSMAFTTTRIRSRS